MKTTGDTRFIEPRASLAPGVRRLWLVDDDDNYRKLQCQLLRQDAQWVCVESYASADAALAALASVTPPDLILMDVNMPGTGGIEAIPQVRALAPEVRILMNSTFTNPLDERAAFGGGRFRLPDQVEFAGGTAFRHRGCDEPAGARPDDRSANATSPDAPPAELVTGVADQAGGHRQSVMVDAIWKPLFE